MRTALAAATMRVLGWLTDAEPGDPLQAHHADSLLPQQWRELAPDHVRPRIRTLQSTEHVCPWHAVVFNKVGWSHEESWRAQRSKESV